MMVAANVIPDNIKVMVPPFFPVSVSKTMECLRQILCRSMKLDHSTGRGLIKLQKLVQIWTGIGNPVRFKKTTLYIMMALIRICRQGPVVPKGCGFIFFYAPIPDVFLDTNHVVC